MPKYAVSYEILSPFSEEVRDTRTHTIQANTAMDAAVRIAQLRNQPDEYYVQELPFRHGEALPASVVVCIVILAPLPVDPPKNVE